MYDVISQWEGILILEELHFHPDRNIVSETISVRLTQVALVLVAFLGSDLECPLYYTFKVPK